MSDERRDGRQREGKVDFSATIADAPAMLLRQVPQVAWQDPSGPKSISVDHRMIAGAAPQCELCIDDRAVSRLHVELDPRSDGLWVRDLASRNGTYANGMRVESARLQNGDRLSLGSTTLTVRYAQVSVPPPSAWPGDEFGPLRGQSAAMRELFTTLARVAPTEASVLIHGETGVGKELVAQSIHEASQRANERFVVVDCAALSETLIDAELFGHTRGAFTGAQQARAGAFEEAHGGTIFLDEIGELPLSMQPKLLRVLESGTIRRLGETQYRPVNVRVVSATHRDLLAMVGRGAFREDLYFRLAVFPVYVPALRERIDDLQLLSTFFAKGSPLRFEPETLRALMSRPWPGNVRELRNFVERARTLGVDAALAFMTGAEARREQTSLMPAPLTSFTPPAIRSIAPPSIEAGSEQPSFAQSFRAFRAQWVDYGEREFVRALLERTSRDVAAAAEQAGVDRSYLYRIMRKHGL